MWYNIKTIGLNTIYVWGVLMKVIFLDFDGVINDWYTMNSVNIDNVLILKQIIDMTGAKIVVTSSNKYNFQRGNVLYEDSLCYRRYVQALLQNGINVYDYTKDYNDRELEIITYLKEHNDITKYLILDDDYIFNFLKEHQVFLDLYKGLCEEHINHCFNILNGNLGFYPSDFDMNETDEKRLIRINEYYSGK